MSFIKIKKSLCNSLLIKAYTVLVLYDVFRSIRSE